LNMRATLTEVVGRIPTYSDGFARALGAAHGGEPLAHRCRSF